MRRTDWLAFAQKAGNGKRIGLFGFGAAAHILTQICVWQGREVYAFTRAGDRAAQQFALDLGAMWAGSSQDNPSVPLDAAIIFAPVGDLVPAALKAVRKGGTVVVRRNSHERYSVDALCYFVG